MWQMSAAAEFISIITAALQRQNTDTESNRYAAVFQLYIPTAGQGLQFPLVAAAMRLKNVSFRRLITDVAADVISSDVVYGGGSRAISRRRCDTLWQPGTRSLRSVPGRGGTHRKRAGGTPLLQPGISEAHI